MPQNNITEIVNYLKHQDVSLAVRRTLDESLDNGDKMLIKEAINWSKKYHLHSNNEDVDAIPEQFFDDGYSLINKLEKSQKKVTTTPTRLIVATKISKKYKTGNFSLKPIDIAITSGDIVGIVGENGNGKTTLLRCLAGQLSLDSGTIEYDLLNNPDYYAIKNYIVFIPQRIPRWYGLLKDNLHFSASIAGIHGEENELMVAFMLERLNLSAFALLDWNQISSGYRTRFELARVLLQKPQILILDEPLANLDINAQQTVLTDLKYLANSVYNPMGILLSSQQLHEVEKIADKVLFIKQGSCIYQTGQNENEIVSSAVEIESIATREHILDVLAQHKVHIQFNGGFYTITSAESKVEAIIHTLIIAKIPITYFRDITHSTKRYFN